MTTQMMGLGLVLVGVVLYIIVGSWLASYRTDLEPGQSPWRDRRYRHDSSRYTRRMLNPFNYTPEGRSRIPLLYLTLVVMLIGVWLFIGDQLTLTMP